MKVTSGDLKISSSVTVRESGDKLKFRPLRTVDNEAPSAGQPEEPDLRMCARPRRKIQFRRHPDRGFLPPCLLVRAIGSAPASQQSEQQRLTILVQSSWQGPQSQDITTRQSGKVLACTYNPGAANIHSLCLSVHLEIDHESLSKGVPLASHCFRSQYGLQDCLAGQLRIVGCLS